MIVNSTDQHNRFCFSRSFNWIENTIFLWQAHNNIETCIEIDKIYSNNICRFFG